MMWVKRWPEEPPAPHLVNNSQVSDTICQPEKIRSNQVNISPSPHRRQLTWLENIQPVNTSPIARYPSHNLQYLLETWDRHYYCRPCCCVAKLSLFCLNPFRADTCLMSAPPPSPPLPSLGTYKVLSYHQYLTIDIGHQEIRDGVMIHLVSRDYCFLRRFAFKSNQSVWEQRQCLVSG